MSSLRERIRVVTDGLAADAWLKLGEIREALPEPQPHPSTMAVTVHKMVQNDHLMRRGTYGLYEYRSGPKPIVDGRDALKGKRRREHKHLGSVALCRLMESNPAEFERLTADDQGWRR